MTTETRDYISIFATIFLLITTLYMSYGSSDRKIGEVDQESIRIALLEITINHYQEAESYSEMLFLGYLIRKN